MIPRGIRVMILMGSRNDWATMKSCRETLDQWGVAHEAAIASAHRTPERVESLVREAEEAGAQVFIAAAGMAAHLAGAVAARTTRPVIGVPIASGPFQGFDSLLSTVQMPPGLPVLTVTAGPAGGVNAALAAIQILALSDAGLSARLADHRREMAEDVERQNQELNQELLQERNPL